MLGEVLTKWSTFSWGAMLSMLLVVGASVGVFAALALRSTTRRRWVAMTEWAQRNGFSLQRGPAADLPPGLEALAEQSPRVLIVMSKGQTSLVRVQTLAPEDRTSAPTTALTWHLLVHTMGEKVESGPPVSWERAGLRPVVDAASIVDLYSLTGFPGLLDAQRFVVHARDSKAAGALAQSPAPTLLPPDIGLVLDVNHLVLDFSTRPFDEIEFNRMLVLGEQLAGHLVGNP